MELHWIWSSLGNSSAFSILFEKLHDQNIPFVSFLTVDQDHLWRIMKLEDMWGNEEELVGYFRVSPNLLYPSELTEACGASFASVPDVMSRLEQLVPCYGMLKYAFSQFLNWDMMLFQKLPVGKFVLEENLYLLATINVMI